MIALFFALTPFAQGTALQNDNGTIAGVLKTSTGQPAVGVRVAAMASLVTTEEAGRYRLENIPPGRYSSAQKLAGFFGRVVEVAGGSPISQGSVTVLGGTRTTIPIGPDGKFVLPHLLPGSYDFRVEMYEHFTRYETVVIDDQDVHADLAVRSNLATAEERATSQAEPPQ
jgi:hypothetical protein